MFFDVFLNFIMQFYYIILFVILRRKHFKNSMKLFALETNNNDIFRNIRKKQFNLHSQQKLIYRDMLRNKALIDFRKKEYYRIVVNGVPS